MKRSILVKMATLIPVVCVVAAILLLLNEVNRNEIQHDQTSSADLPASVYQRGTFMMGSPEGEQRRSSDEGPQHKVKVESFWMAKYPDIQYDSIGFRVVLRD